MSGIIGHLTDGLTVATSSPTAGFLERIASKDDPDLIRVLYGDFVRKVFQGYRVTVTPVRPTPGATGVPQLSEMGEGEGRYGRVRLFDDLVVVSGPPGSLREEHLKWLQGLRQATQTRLDEIDAALNVDEMTGLASERVFHTSLLGLPRKERWGGWLMCVTILPDPAVPLTVDDVERMGREIAEYLRSAQPEGGALFRMNNGFFAGLVPSSTPESLEELGQRLSQGLEGLEVAGAAGLKAVIGVCLRPPRAHTSFEFYQKLVESLRGHLTLSDLRKVRPRRKA